MLFPQRKKFMVRQEKSMVNSLVRKCFGYPYDVLFEVRNPEEIKQLLAAANQRFLDYKMMVEGDPNFGKRFFVPPVKKGKNKKNFFCGTVLCHFVCFLFSEFCDLFRMFLFLLRVLVLDSCFCSCRCRCRCCSGAGRS